MSALRDYANPVLQAMLERSCLIQTTTRALSSLLSSGNTSMSLPQKLRRTCELPASISRLALQHSAPETASVRLWKLLHLKMMHRSTRQSLAPLIITKSSMISTSDRESQQLSRTAHYPEMQREDLNDLDILEVFGGISDEDIVCSSHVEDTYETNLKHDLSDNDLLDCSAGADYMRVDVEVGGLIESDTDDVLSVFTEELLDVLDDCDQLLSSQSSIESSTSYGQTAVSPMLGYADWAELTSAAEVDNMMLDLSEDEVDLLCRI